MMGARAPQTQNRRIGKKLGIGLGIVVAMIAIALLINELTWLPARQEVAELAKQPIASKELLGMKLRSSNEVHAIPAERSFLGKPRSAQVNRYFDMPAGETRESLLERLQKEAERDGWVVDYRDENQYFFAKKDLMRLEVGVDPDSQYSPVYVSLEKE